MITCLGKSCSFGLRRVPFVNCCQFMFLVISLLIFRGCGIWLYQFLIIAYLFTWCLRDFYPRVSKTEEWNAFRNAVKFSSGSSELSCNVPNLCKYHWGKLSCGIFFQPWDIQSLWSFPALWLPCRVDDDVEYADNQSIICLVVCSTNGLCHSGMMSVFPPYYASVWNEDASSMIFWCSLVDGRLYWWSEGHVEHIFVGVEDNYCCIPTDPINPA